MGNTHSSAFVSRTVGALDTYVAELGPDVSYDKSLGSSRFLKTVRCRHRNGYLVVKMFIKPDGNALDERYLRRLKKERKMLQDIPNVYPYQAFLETEKAGYLIRQWVASSLYDRISTRPFLTVIEKKWISFQIITALRDARKRKISHGDIKSENILVTSWNWVYVTDFSSFKPTFLPLDNPADFAYFYDTSGKRNCYIAPERFFTTEKTPESSFKRAMNDSSQVDSEKRDNKITEAMDVFSAGCVLAELFLEGAAPFSLSQLFKYRAGELDVNVHLAGIEEELVRDLIKCMIALEPTERPLFDMILHTSRGTIFPESFYSPLYDFVSSVTDISASSPFTTSSAGTATPSSSSLPSAAGTIDEKQLFANGTPEDTSILPTDSDRRIMRVWAEYDVIEPVISTADLAATIKIDFANNYSSSKPLQTLTPVVLHLANARTRILSSMGAPAEDGPALVILALICANIRNSSLPTTKLRALDVLLALSVNLTDEAKLDRLIPYVIELLHDETPVVRAAALRTTLQLLLSVNVITPFNGEVFPRYLLPVLRQLAVDQDVSVRSVCAQSIVMYASLAVKYLEMGQALRAHGTIKFSSDAHHYDETQYEVSYDASMEELQNLVAEFISTLLVDPSSVVKRSVLLDIAPLCIFFGRQKTNDLLLSHMITYLNDRDWLLRYAFFDSIVDVAACLGGRNLEEYIFPLMQQALSDAEETNVAKVLASLTTLSELSLFQKMRLWELMSSTLPLLYHSNLWIRQGSAAFIAAAAKQLPKTDVWCILYPSLRHYMRSEVRDVDVRSILLSLKAALPRHIYDFALDWSMRSPQSQFWRSHRKAVNKIESPKEAVGSMRRVGKVNARTVTRSEEDDAQLQKLEQLGMSQLEEVKLVALKDHISKSANSINSLRSRQKIDSESDALQTTGFVELQKLGVVPNTIFLGSRQARTSELIQGSRKISVSDGRVLSHASSFDRSSSGAPLEDLKRRLATMNGSNTSVGSGRGHTVSAAAAIQRPPTVDQDVPNPADFRPGSPTESAVSTATSSIRPRFSIGSVESQKAAPAVGSVRANAVGLLEAPGKIRLEVSPDRGVNPTIFISPNAQSSRNRPSSTHDDGQDTVLNKLVENLYASANKDSQTDFGPHVHDGPIRRRNPTRQSFTIRESSKRRSPSTTLITHLLAHSDAVNDVAVSPDHVFFVTASDDKTVKVWDTARLERNVTSKARHTYSEHHARVKAVCMMENSHCFASAAEDGSLHVVRVLVSQIASFPKYSKLQVVREHQIDRPGEYITCMVQYNSDFGSNLIYATNRSVLTALDLQTMQVSQVLRHPLHLGPVVSLCLDKKRTWMVSATSTGFLTLWDLRFGLLLRSWEVGTSCTNRPVQIRQCALHPTKGRGRWVMVSLDNTEREDVVMEVWDVETGSLVECFISSGGTTEASMEMVGTHRVDNTEVNPASAIDAFVAGRQRGDSASLPRQSPTYETDSTELKTMTKQAISSFVVGSEFGGHTSSARSFVDLAAESSPRHSSRPGFIVLGTKDHTMKFWDLDKFDRSFTLVSDDDDDASRPSYGSQTNAQKVNLHVETHVSSHLSNAAGGAQRSAHVQGHQRNLLRAHQDQVSAIACVDSPFRGCIISGDRSGAIKVWRVDDIESGSTTSYP
ncbi:WD40 repeat-like protein [Schizopora paradoxa]|uniref:non-specific serine/threonine protein kinase n=1 Tax=Schizopora paradoxa TaxID=27342 RepID=A0A0H2RU62_9AGAM|nr:WD40 repeat-like protein [Schizopora paradoxa]